MVTTTKYREFGPRYEVRERCWYDGPHAGLIAFDRTLARLVVIHAPYGAPDEDRFRRFLHYRELREPLRHPNLVPLLDSGIADGVPFFTEPCMQWRLLKTVITEHVSSGEPLDFAQLVSRLAGVFAAFAMLPRHGAEKPGLTPFDVFVEHESGALFLDLTGLRPHDGLPSTMSEEGIRFGSPAYMAPEQARGEASDNSDVYVVGGVLFFVLYASPPNAGVDLVETLKALAARKGPPLAGALIAAAMENPSVARRLEAVCLRALDREPTRRQSSVTAFIEEMTAALGDTSVTSR